MNQLSFSTGFDLMTRPKYKINGALIFRICSRKRNSPATVDSIGATAGQRSIASEQVQSASQPGNFTQSLGVISDAPTARLGTPSIS